MSEDKGGKKGKRREKLFRPVKLFFKTVCSIVLAFVILAGGSCFAYYKITGQVPFSNGGIYSNATDTSFLEALFRRNIKMNVAVLGVDKDGVRTDVNFVVHYDSAKESIDIVSVPRDTRVMICDRVESRLQEAGRSYNRETKFNSVFAYSGKEMGCENTVLQLEDLLGIQIDHYVKIDLEAFRKIVDAVGGVDVYVPQDMYWDMRDTGDPLIDLKKGMQHLDGEKAEQLVRFRRYHNGDVGRIEVQQLFMKELAEKVLNTGSILKALPQYISVLYEDVETDIKLKDALKYVNYINKVDMMKISMETIPGEGAYIGDVSYYVHDPVKTREMVDRIFYNAEDETSAEELTSKGVLIEVSNGGDVAGLAGEYGQRLAADGYTVAPVTNFDGKRKKYTRIQVDEHGMGKDLLPYFEKPKIEKLKEPLDSGAKIRIILGTEER